MGQYKVPADWVEKKWNTKWRAASKVRVIDPKSGEVIEEIEPKGRWEYTKTRHDKGIYG